MEPELQTLQFETSSGSREVKLQIKRVPRTRGFKLWLADAENAVLTMPLRASTREAENFLNANLAWLAKQVENAKPREKLSAYLVRKGSIFAGDKIWKVYLQTSRAGAFFVEDDANAELVLAVENGDEAELLNQLIGFARIKLERKARAIAEYAGLTFNRFSIKNQSSRWASMSTTGTLSLNWRVALLPEELQTYIFAHELAHTRFMDHSVSFWIFLNKICPNARRLDARVSTLGKELFLVG